ncbi:RDD family protein [Bacillus sp. EAC]|uniref:RDD family protein n=1 Tax=Bacillus sp. EAC TaxID=1978338 RepID=UPI000B44DF6A|nr:RDD family protein [Bacillus sp. EAC]
MQNLQLARFYHRLSAFIFDMFIVSICYGVIIALITMKPEKIFSRFNSTSGNSTIDIIVIFAIMLLLFVFVPIVNKGMTLGQRMMSVKMIKDNYEETKVGIFLVRFIFIAVLSILLLGIPVILNAYLMLFRKDRKTLQDLVFKTSVIQTR